MIVRLEGQLVEKREQAVVINVSGVCYEVIVPASVLQRIDAESGPNGNVNLVTYYYFQMSPSSGNPVLIGFMNEVERDFFLHFIKVSGIGPRAAVRALSQPISQITQAIDNGDVAYLKTLPGIGAQRAKEIVAKLQGKIGKFGLIRDTMPVKTTAPQTDWQQEALDVLLQLQYKRNEALDMIQRTLEKCPGIRSAEELLNEIYRQKSTREHQKQKVG